MIVNADIVLDYIEGNLIEEYKDQWYFHNKGYSFARPTYETEHREAVKRIYDQIINILKDFIPFNNRIWDILFPNWKLILKEVTITLIVGYPEPNDATVLQAPNGQKHVILDLGLWTKYEGKCDIACVIHNLLTHELCHVCIGNTIKDIDADTQSSDYKTNLDANTFHEGFAHLLSFDDKDMEEVNWNHEKWLRVKRKSQDRMSAALSESDVNEQMKFLYEAVYGNYEEKYACMCGMFYLVNCWKRDGIAGLKQEYITGYHGFAKRTVED